MEQMLPTGRLLEAMIESLDEFYSANLGEEITRGLRESASRGFYLHSRPPYGYHKVKIRDGNKERPRLEVDPHQALMVTTIFHDVIEGKGLKEIVKELNHNGVAGPKGATWGKTTLHKILNRVSSAGELWLSLIRGVWPAATC